MLREKLTISRYDSIVPGGRYHNFKDFINFPNVGKANLVNKPLPRLRHIGLIKPSSAMVLMPFANAMCCSIILITPLSMYWNCCVRLRSTRAYWRLKLTFTAWRKIPRIIDSMIHAAHNGKKVTVVVELQARFDEEANIHWAKRLTEAGVHVIFSAPGLKIHAKLFLIHVKKTVKWCVTPTSAPGTLTKKPRVFILTIRC